MTSNMKLLLAVSSAKSFVSAEEKKRWGAGEAVITSMHKFIFPHRWNPWKLKLHATCLWGNPINGGFQLSQYPRMRWRLTRFCFVSPWRPRAALLSLYIEECLCVTALFPDESDVICRPSPSFTPSPPSLWTPSITCPSERVAWQWCDGATQTVKMDCYLGRLARTHAHTKDVWHTNTQAESHVRAFTHIRNTQSHTCMTVQSRILLHTCTVQWTPGPVSRRSLNLTQCSSWKQAKGGIMLPLPPRWLETHLSYFLPFTHTYLSTLV